MHEPTPPATPDPGRHGRIVLRTAGIWLAVHLGLWLFFSLPRCIDWLRPVGTYTTYGSCSGELGIVAFIIGLLQLVYGFFLLVLIGIVRALRRDRSRITPIVQGIAIACALIFLLSSALCFGALMANA